MRTTSRSRGGEVNFMHGSVTNNLIVVKSNFALKLTNIRGKFRRLAGVTKKLTKIRCAKHLYY